MVYGVMSDRESKNPRPLLKRALNRRDISYNMMKSMELIIFMKYIVAPSIGQFFNDSFLLQELLTSTSQQLFETTERKSRFDSISVLLPASWSGSDCLNGRPINDKISAPYRPDFVVSNEHPLFGDSRPMAMQYGQCGQSGLGIRIPHGLLNRGNLTDFTSKS